MSRNKTINGMYRHLFWKNKFERIEKIARAAKETMMDSLDNEMDNIGLIFLRLIERESQHMKDVLKRELNNGQ